MFMSYEGREVYICPKGHVNIHNCYDDWDWEDYYNIDGEKTSPKEEKQHKCYFCGEILSHVGRVDDTNGEAVSNFYKKVIRKCEINQSYDAETDTLTMTHKPEICEIVRGGRGEFFNFDTGEPYLVN